MPQLRRYYWLSSLQDRPPTQRREVRDQLALGLGITDLFMSCGRRTGGAWSPGGVALAEAVEDLWPLRVHASIFEWREELVQQEVERILGSVRRKIAACARYQLEQRARPRARLAGVHLDVEPHATRAWARPGEDQQRRRRDLLNRLRLMADATRRALDQRAEAGLDFSLATAWWYHEHPEVSCARLTGAADAVVPMAYNTPEAPVLRGGRLERWLAGGEGSCLDLWAGQCRPGSRFVLGLGLREFEDEERLLAAADRVERWAAAGQVEAFGGVAIFAPGALRPGGPSGG